MCVCAYMCACACACVCVCVCVCMYTLVSRYSFAWYLGKCPVCSTKVFPLAWCVGLVLALCTGVVPWKRWLQLPSSLCPRRLPSTLDVALILVVEELCISWNVSAGELGLIHYCRSSFYSMNSIINCMQRYCTKYHMLFPILFTNNLCCYIKLCAIQLYILHV